MESLPKNWFFKSVTYFPRAQNKLLSCQLAVRLRSAPPHGSSARYSYYSFATSRAHSKLSLSTTRRKNIKLTHSTMKVILVTLCTLFIPALCDVEFSRTITAIGDSGSLDLELSGPDGDECKSEDEYGSNDCVFQWGDSVTGSFAGELGKPLESGSTINVDMKINKFIPFAFSCGACGVNCTITVPVVNEDVTVPMPACPIPAGVIDIPFATALPAQSPLPAKITAVGSIGWKDAAGGDVLDMDVNILAQ